MSSPRLTIVVPTFNERGNIAELVRRVDAAFGPAGGWEMVFVDDNSPDGTAELAKQLADADPRVRCLRRVHRRGLSGACIEGMLSSAAPYVAVMDADLQHDEAILPRMLQRLEAGQLDLVVGSRLAGDGSATGGLSAKREASSRIVATIVGRFFPRGVNDVLSGFFMMRREAFDRLAPQLEQSGFKILADILITAGDSLRTEEIGFDFRPRHAGESKLDSRVVLDFAGLLLNKLTRGLLPVRFVFFAIVGASGVVVHLIVLRLALITAGLSFAVAQSLATLVAMTWNFYINNQITYRDSRLHGGAFVYGLLLFYLVCGIGAVANVGMANWLFMREPTWWLAGIAGAAVGAIWNYALSSSIVWRKK
ncbi:MULTISPECIES: glycosyltransferase family 2 protein [unclassified Beijerinckia]|uniref:glycosyltransferase family 2 protein n=1 Tax=unclassified Beijerinckia TaxID=2638183 RepID=UPI000A716ADA|nr:MULTISPECIES: glycosyltransferase family 2 protein [unclassified Beijerinckia]MDH7796702.1 dolichol-phosphate mannosyltransferase [Beijerinckia sp. GAS462]